MVLKNKDSVSISSGNLTLTGFTVIDGQEEFEPESIKLTRGPYNIHMSVIDTHSSFTVQQMKIEKRRPALFGPEKFADLKSIKMGEINSIKQLRRMK